MITTHPRCMPRNKLYVNRKVGEYKCSKVGQLLVEGSYSTKVQWPGWVRSLGHTQHIWVRLSHGSKFFYLFPSLVCDASIMYKFVKCVKLFLVFIKIQQRSKFCPLIYTAAYIPVLLITNVVHFTKTLLRLLLNLKYVLTWQTMKTSLAADIKSYCQPCETKNREIWRIKNREK